MNKNDKEFDSLLRCSQRYRAVAFDVFDTLLYRDVGKPEDLFRLMGPTFCEKRLQAEAEVRAAHGGEVTLEEIYARQELAGYSPADECGAELRSVAPNATLLHFAKACKERGQRVYAVSDMYLPQEQIQAMLNRCGYDFLDGVFVSSAYGVQKRSGKLFRQFLQETGLPAGDVLFFGDDLRADVLGAALCGIRSLHYNNRGRRLTPSVSWQGQALAAFTANRLQEERNKQEAIGYRVVGPILYAFADWLHTQRIAAPERPLLFLARDMYLVSRVYRAQYPEDTNTAYLQVSRRSLCPGILASGNTSLLKAALPRRKMLGAEIAAYCGALCPEQDQNTSFDLKSTAQEEKIQAFLMQLTPATGAEPLMHYLHTQPLQEGAFLVDIGSGGTTQHLLETLLGISLRGLYLACDERLRRIFPPERAAVYLFDGAPAPRTYWAGQPMLERLLSEENGSVAGYGLTGGLPKLLRTQTISGPSVEQYQAGALRFVQDMQQSALACLAVAPQDVITPFLRLVDSPTREEVDSLGDVQIEDGGSWPLAAPSRPKDYLRRAARFSKEFGAAPWKVGFLKRLLRLPLPYGTVYRLLKH